MKLIIGLTLFLLGLFLLALFAGGRLSNARALLPAPADNMTEEAHYPTGNPAVADAPPVIVELFTSEGCSSCPPADQVLMRLDQERVISGATVIALSQHVDYWNRLGWRDPFSSEQFSQRQGGYADAFGRDGVYTPQMVVDGRAEFVGSNLTKAREAIAQAARTPKAKVQITFAPTAERAKSAALPIIVGVENLPPLSANDTAEAWLAITESDLSSSVPTGENAGRNLRHTAVVRQLSSIGTIVRGDAKNGAPFTATHNIFLERHWRRDKLRVVVFVQEQNSKHVLGATMIDLAK
ncbi:MAG: DUF1223 domain-containing protein [Pyrinomonadaceae bacterium]